MQELFIAKIHIGKVRHLENFDIVLSDTERKHLILTGKNGSGKTSLLEAMRDKIFAQQYKQYLIFNEEDKKHVFKTTQRHIDQAENSSKNINVDFSAQPDYAKSTFVYVSAMRNKVDVPDSISQILNSGKTIITRNASKDFLKYVLNLYVQYLSAKDSGGSTEDIARYVKWFDNFTNALREIYDCHKLEIKPDMKNLAFQIVMPGHEPFRLHEMSDGYAAFIDIYMELLMRMESSDAVVEYENPAIVLIDEIETHLHVELQKRILPFLTKVFPNIQFIVATHSPFVITSLEKAIVYDLEKHIRLDGDLTEYSYTDIIEGYYDVSECSAGLKSDFDRYVELCNMDSRTAIERDETRKLFERLNKIPGTSPLSAAFYMFERGRKW
ncbi:MAG: AAA family ATPase [Oscillospiraceae bacterium]|nr:AAA family ATPase [Oscillospiraceae bacterium]